MKLTSAICTIPLAIRRRGELLGGRLGETELRFGDDLLIEVRKEAYQSLLRSGDFIFTQELEKQTTMKRRCLWLWPLAGVILLAAFNVLHILEGALIGTILMFILKIISIREAYRDVDWRIIFLLASLIPLVLQLKIPVPPICWPTTSITRYHVSGRSLSSPVFLPSPHWLPVSCQTEPQPCCFLPLPSAWQSKWGSIPDRFCSPSCSLLPPATSHH